MQLLPGARGAGPRRIGARVGRRDRRPAPHRVGDVPAVSGAPPPPRAVGERRPVRRPRRPQARDGGHREPRSDQGRAGADGAAPRRGARGGSLRLLDRARLCAERVRRHRRAGQPGAEHGGARRPLLLPHPRRGGHPRDGARRGDQDRRGRGRARPGLPREGVGARELGKDGPSASDDRFGPGARARRHRRRVSVSRREHQDGQPPARLDARRRHRQATGAAGRSGGAAPGDAGLPGRRRALAHRLGRHGLGRDHDRHVLPAGVARSPPGRAGPAHRQGASRRHDGSGARGKGRRLHDRVLAERGQRGHGPPLPPRDDRLGLALAPCRPRSSRRPATPAELRDVSARARRLLPGQAALLVGDGGAEDDRDAGREARAPRPRPVALAASPPTSPCSTRSAWPTPRPSPTRTVTRRASRTSSSTAVSWWTGRGFTPCPRAAS